MPPRSVEASSMDSATPLDSLVARRLVDRDAPALSSEESRACLVSCIQHGKAAAQRAAKQRVVVVLGNTGAGKSAFINMCHGCSFAYEEEDKMVVVVIQ